MVLSTVIANRNIYRRISVVLKAESTTPLLRQYDHAKTDGLCHCIQSMTLSFSMKMAVTPFSPTEVTNVSDELAALITKGHCPDYEVGYV